MLHLAGADHGGKDDSMNGDNPATMATCIDASTFKSNNFIEQDASAYLNWLHSSLANHQLNANVGFEQGTSFWGMVDGSVTAASSGGATGPGWADFLPTGTVADSYMFQTVRLWTGNDSSVSVRAVINAASPATVVTTHVNAAIAWKDLKQSSSGNGCDYRPGVVNPNDETVSTSAYRILEESGSTDVRLSWQSVASPWYAFSSVHEGHQLQVRAYANSTGNNVVKLDNVRGEENN